MSNSNYNWQDRRLNAEAKEIVTVVWVAVTEQWKLYWLFFSVMLVYVLPKGFLCAAQTVPCQPVEQPPS